LGLPLKWLLCPKPPEVFLRGGGFKLEFGQRDLEGFNWGVWWRFSGGVFLGAYLEVGGREPGPKF